MEFAFDCTRTVCLETVVYILKTVNSNMITRVSLAGILQAVGIQMLNVIKLDKRDNLIT